MKRGIRYTCCDEAPGFDASILDRLWPALRAYAQPSHLIETPRAALLIDGVPIEDYVDQTDDCDHSEDNTLKNGLWLCRQCGATWPDEED